VVNVIVGILKSDCVGHSFLLHSEELEKINHNTICKIFNKTMTILWHGDIMYNNVLLFFSDAASYTVKADSVLKNIYQNDIHHLQYTQYTRTSSIAEEIREQFNTINELISNMKKMFAKPHTMSPAIRLPPEPILTYWGTCLEVAFYYCVRFQIICSVINT
jgi:hypothetical protein